MVVARCRRGLTAAMAAGVLAAGLPSVALAGYGDPPGGGGDDAGGNAPGAEVTAEGNPFTGGLAFDPVQVEAEVGEEVRWTNTDFLVPHTSTEDHALWDLGGSYGLPGQTGYGPGETVSRVFEAGSHVYYCRIHPADMNGIVDVPVGLARSDRHVHAMWAVTRPEQGLVFDVQRRAGRRWRDWRSGTRSTGGRFRGRQKRWQLRARLRSADDAKARTDWSPTATIRG